MASVIEVLNYNAVIISTLDGSNQIDLTNAITQSDYYEDLFSPSVMMTIGSFIEDTICDFRILFVLM